MGNSETARVCVLWGAGAVTECVCVWDSGRVYVSGGSRELPSYSQLPNSKLSGIQKAGQLQLNNWLQMSHLKIFNSLFFVAGWGFQSLYVYMYLCMYLCMSYSQEMSESMSCVVCGQGIESEFL